MRIIYKTKDCPVRSDKIITDEIAPGVKLRLYDVTLARNVGTLKKGRKIESASVYKKEMLAHFQIGKTCYMMPIKYFVQTSEIEELDPLYFAVDAG